MSDGGNGRFVPVHDPAALADAIADVIRDRQRWERLSRNARETAVSRFDENLLFSQMENLYLSLVEGNPA